MVNRVTLVGRLTRDPEVHDTAAGGQVTSLRLVTTDFRKDDDGTRREEVQFHAVVAFGRLAEICGDYLTKGRLVYVEGKLRTREWEGRDSLRRYTTEIVADSMQMLSPKSSDASGEVGPVEAEDAVPAASV